jgi:alcohol dehydrogenase YqhD (iron-dependent ADH family)
MITSFYLPTKIISGAGSFAMLGKEASHHGKRVLLVTGQSSARKTGLLARAVAVLEEHGLSVTVFDRVEPNPRAATVDEGAALIREQGLDLVVALGGGSPMDAAKGMVIAAIGGKPVWSYVGTRHKVTGDVPKLVTVPTVAASGSEANCGAVITNWETHEKCVVSDRCAFPVVSIVDPELTLTLPARPTAQGGVDIFCHLVEPYVTAANPQPLTDGIVETSLKLVAEFLPQVLTRLDDLEARSQLSWASTVACSQFAGLGGGDGSMTLHGIEHPLSGAYDIAHGDGLAALLPSWLKSLVGVRPDRMVKLGCQVFQETDGIAAMEKWLNEVNMAHRLRDFGIKREDLPGLAANALKTASWLRNHPTKLDEGSITDIYLRAW